MKKTLSTDDLVAAFEAGTLNKEQWDHTAHLRIALHTIYGEKSLPRSISKIRTGIIRYNCVQPRNLCSERYNETATIFWVQEVFAFAESKFDAPYEKLEDELLSSVLANPRHIYDYYTKDELTSDEYKALYH
ncbi:MAG: hypothetical protein WAX38_00980 [Minisyncoccia bacterium]